jgi:hypothetical protein
LQELQALAAVSQKGGVSGFTGSPFRARIAQIYEEGAGLVVAANLETVLAQTKTARAKDADAGKHEEALKQLGILNLKYFVLDQNESGGKTHTRASLSFTEAQRGIPSWLAAPSSMGSLEYVSPDANIVAGFAVKNPVAMVDDLMGVLETVSPGLSKNLDQLQADHGLDIRKDFATPLGGEFATLSFARRSSPLACRSTVRQTFRRSSITTWDRWCSPLPIGLQARRIICRGNSSRQSSRWLRTCHPLWLMPMLRATALRLQRIPKAARLG